MRVHILARELDVSSKTIITKCTAEGIDSVKNHMSTLSAGLEATVREWFSEGSHNTAVETAQRIDLKKVRKKTNRKRTKAAAEKAKETTVAATATAVAEAEPPPAVEAPPEVPAVAAEVAPEIVAAPEPPVAPEVAPVEEVVVAEAPMPVVAEAPPETAAIAEAPVEAEAELPPAEAEVAEVPEAKPEGPPAVEEPVVQVTEPMVPVEVEKKPVKPAGPQHVPTPAKLQGPRVVRYEAPDRDVLRAHRGPRKRPDGTDIHAPTPGTMPAQPLETEKPIEKGVRRRGRVHPRRAAGRVHEAGERIAEWGNRDLAERQERLAGATGRRILRRRSVQAAGGAPIAPAGPKTEATVHEPVPMKEFCSATGLSFMQLFKMLKDEHNLIPNINMTLTTETAELLALHFGIELTVIPAKTKLGELKEESAARERKHLTPRPPVVTLLGHVDHGKTSLLDAIRDTRVAAREDGGITQHIGAYHIETDRGTVTFLDTPGHEAFTAMRARGAEATDVVVLVVAADDGIMPQTIEAINHAKAAVVPIVVALNKIDLGDQNKLKIYGQLAEHGLTPSGEWGGEVDVIETSATTGRGITELVEHLADLTSILDFQADPTLPAMGTVVEAETKPGVGAVARVLVQSGTLRVGAFVVCGNAAGKVRALLDDRGKKIKEAGPSIPVEVWGLDDVPTAGDALHEVESLQRAKDVATETKHGRIEESRLQSRKVSTLEEMLLQRDTEEVPELNIIIKADVDGSMAALRQALNKIPSDEVRLTMRHTAVGPVNDSDVLLAAACQGIIVAFRVDASVGARRLAEEHGVDIRQYRVIYNVCDEIKLALEGLLAPAESIEPRATAEVRQVFHLSKAKGIVAGSLVSEGTIDRSHLAKIVRDGVIVRQGCKFASLRRFKDDVKEVRTGMECGVRLEGFDDLHVGDLIQTYEIVKTARKL
jgi:translation initiation factor IF-2